jgi:hypothetical protein
MTPYTEIPAPQPPAPGQPIMHYYRNHAGKLERKLLSRLTHRRLTELLAYVAAFSTNALNQAISSNRHFLHIIPPCSA